MEVWRFEELIAWQKARALVSAMYGATRDGPVAHDFRFRDQIRSAAVSVMSNIAEGADSGTTKEFVRFLNIAKGSAAEVRSDLYIALDLMYVTEEQFSNLYEQAFEVTKIIAGLRGSLLKKIENEKA